MCGSGEIIETIQGYVCQTCGIELELQNLHYDRPYNDDIVQYAKGLGRTKIGTEQERLRSPYYKKLQRLNRYNSHTEYEQEILQTAEIEISKISSCLKIESYDDMKAMFFHKFKDIWTNLEPRGKYKNVEKLVPLIIYFCLKMRNISISRAQIIKESAISKKEFNDFYQQVQKFIPEYKERNRQEYIHQLFLEISWNYNLGIVFYQQAKKILYKLWNDIKNTTDNVIAGLVSSISVLCSTTFRSKVKVSTLCEHLEITMSTIQNQVKKKIFKRFKVDGFVSLVKSAGVLQQIFKNLGLLEANDKEILEEDKVKIVFGNATEIFNQHGNIDYYFFALLNDNNNSTVIYVKIYRPLMNFEENEKLRKNPTKFLDFSIVRYIKGKDPP